MTEDDHFLQLAQEQDKAAHVVWPPSLELTFDKKRMAFGRTKTLNCKRLHDGRLSALYIQ